MNKALIIIVLVFLTNFAFSQGINFQGVARSANGTILASTNISLRLSIISKNVDATPEYVETKTVVTNAQGIFSVVVGDATNAVVTGNFKNIAWKDGIKFLKVEMDPAAGTTYINMGTTQLQYVPYSFYSLGVDAANVTGVLPIENGGTGSKELTSNNVLLGNGTSPVLKVAPGTSGNVLTSDGTTWKSLPPNQSNNSSAISSETISRRSLNLIYLKF
jgi:hypothetical protein